MPNRDVTLTIHVKDGEVVAATGNVERLNAATKNVGKGGAPNLKEVQASAEGVDRAMAKAAQRLGISYDQMVAKIKSASAAAKTSSTGFREVDKAIDGTASAAKGLEDATVSAGTGLASLGSKAGPVGLAIAAVALVIVGLIVVTKKLADKVFELAKAFADYALQIGKVSEETGLATQTVSALVHEAERFGTTFDSLKSPIENFRKNIGQAIAGSSEASARLKTLGLDALTAGQNIDQAFRDAIATIVASKDPVEQVRLAYAAFGEEGYKLLPFFRSFNGDVDAAIKRARELGIVIGGEDVTAARQFNAAYTDLHKTIKGLTDLFGREFLPMVTGVLRDFGSWLQTNKDDIKSWAQWTADWVQVAIDRWTAFFNLVERSRKASSSYDLVYAPDGTLIPQPKPVPPPLAPSVPQTFGGVQTTVPGLPRDLDPAVMEAARQEAEKKRKELEEFAKRDLNASIQYAEQAARNLATSLSGVFGKLKEELEKSGNIEQFERQVDSIVKQYIAKVGVIDQILQDLEKRKAAGDKTTPAEQNVLEQRQQTRNLEFAKRYEEVQKQAQDAVDKHRQRSSAEAIAEAEAELRKKQELNDLYYRHDMENRENAFRFGEITEEQFLEVRKKAELDLLVQRKAALEELLKDYDVNAKKRATIEGEIKKVQQEIDQQVIRNANAMTAAAERRLLIAKEIRDLERENADPARVETRRRDQAREEKLQLMREISALEDAIANQGKNDQLIIEAALLRDILEMRNRELDAVITINRAQLELNHAMDISTNQIRARVYDHLAQQRTLNEAIADGINKTYDALGARLDEQIDKMFEWAGVFQSLFAEPLKAVARNSVTKITRGLLDAIVPGLGTELTKTNNPIARPIVEEIGESNKRLDRIISVLGGGLGGTGTGGGGFSLSSIFGSIFGGGAGQGPGGTPVFNPNAGSSSRFYGQTLNPQRFDLSGLLAQINAANSADPRGNDILGNLKGLFSNKPGGIFAPVGGSKFAGILSGAGDIATLIGGIVGGKAGSILSGIGAGISLGATIGSIFPGIGTAIGAAIGAIVGAIGGIFGGPNKDKTDKKENLPKLNAGFAEAFKQLRELLDGVRHLSIDPDEAVSRAQEIRGEIASGFGIQWQSKTFRKKSQQMITSKLVEADAIIGQIKAAAEIARGAADRSQRILPEFAAGHYFADFFTPNGLMPGMFDGRDNILAMISRGEMVLNPMQQQRVRALAGHDVFAGAGIPNYPNASSSPKLAAGGIAGTGIPMPNITVQPNVTLVLEGASFTDQTRAYLESDDGRRTAIRVLKEEKKYDRSLRS